MTFTRKPRHLYALNVLQKAVAANDIPPSLSSQELVFLGQFFNTRQLAQSLQLIDLLTHGPHLEPSIESIRPTKPALCDSLLVLSDLWAELEAHVMYTSQLDQPEAHQLYDLLADTHIRELLVAHDDIANLRYTTDQCDLEPIESINALTNPDASRSNQLSPQKFYSTANGRDSGTIKTRASVADRVNRIEQRSFDDQLSATKANPLDETTKLGQVTDRPEPSKRRNRTNSTGRRRTTHLSHSQLTLQPTDNGPVDSSTLPTRQGARQPDRRRSLDQPKDQSPAPKSRSSRSGASRRVKLVQLHRQREGEPLGVTVSVRTPSPNKSPSSHPQLAIQRVLVDSLAYRQGQLQPGDILLEFNGQPVDSLDQVYSLMQQSTHLMTCELLIETPERDGLFRPGQKPPTEFGRSKRYIRAFFDYDADSDELQPTGDVGLSFKAGDVLELVNDQDPNWWQVRQPVTNKDQVRLIPSQTLVERREASDQESENSTFKRTRRKSKSIFRASDSSDLRLRGDLWTYEEVVPWPHSKVSCLLLLGATGLGRRTLKSLLCISQPHRFAFPLPDTSDSRASPDKFRLLAKSRMEGDIKAGAYLEWGRVDGGHLYGIRYSTIRDIIDSGRTVVLDCQPQSVYLLHQPEFNPLTVMIAAPTLEAAQAMQRAGLEAKLTRNKRSLEQLQTMLDESEKMAKRYRHLYTHKFINSNIKECCKKLLRLISRFESQPCWIPAGWAYELSIPGGSAVKKDRTFLPGSSSLSALGISDLPASRSSVIGRSIGSGISEPSIESAIRMAQPSLHSESSSQPHKRMYEKRRKPLHDFHPMSPTIAEKDTPPESAVSSLVNVRRIQIDLTEGHSHGKTTPTKSRVGESRESIASNSMATAVPAKAVDDSADQSTLCLSDVSSTSSEGEDEDV